MIEHDTDVVVIGSGVAGLAAAAEAARRGAGVIVLEAATSIGGASAMSGAACCIVGTPEQAALGIEDTVERALTDWAEFGGPTADLEWARRYLENSYTDVYQWCVEAGGTWESPLMHEGNSVPRWHPAGQFGIGIIEGILRRLHGRDATVITDARAERFIMDDGRIVGVRAVGTDESYNVRCRAVIVATGGFVNNRDLLVEHSSRLRQITRFLLGGSATAVGSGHEILDSAGAQFVSMGNVWIYPNGTPDPQDATGNRGLGLRRVGTDLWINELGERFHDESLQGGRSGTDAILSQPGQHVWSVFDGSEAADVILIDNEHYSTPAGPCPDAMSTFWDESDHAVRTDTVEELATFTGLPVAALRKSIAQFNDALESGAETDPLTGRRLDGLRPVGRNGFAAVNLFPMAQKNFGGVRTDLDGKVLDREGTPIPGLYAAGEVAGMAGGSINGTAGLEGTMFGPCLYSGRVAGRSVEF
ncbi:putative oxidoreductase [Rhodococcus sp. 27YEA15]|uniref:FAD-dependent oxidoreductase n=1 Tax=Rhodococcus sp. 27YEA15 TaxID=3156259 RepID=UPI003C7CEDDA